MPQAVQGGGLIPVRVGQPSAAPFEASSAASPIDFVTGISAIMTPYVPLRVFYGRANRTPRDNSPMNSGRDVCGSLRDSVVASCILIGRVNQARAECAIGSDRANLRIGY